MSRKISRSQQVVDNDDSNNLVSFERQIYDEFNLDIKIKAVICNDIPISHSGKATVFLTDRQLLFCYMNSVTRLTLGDVKKVLNRMSLKPQKFIAPHADVDYFDDFALEKFNKTFPGRKLVTDDDLSYYKTLAPYSPALIQIAEISGGVIGQYDSMAVGNWRPSTHFSYRRLLTS